MSVPEPTHPSEQPATSSAAPESPPSQPTSGPPSQPTPAMVPGSDVELPEETQAAPVRTLPRVDRERPDFDGTPTAVKALYVVIAVALLAMFVMAAISIFG